MSEFELHKYSAMAYESNQIITFSENPSMALPDVDEEMKFHTGVSSIQVSNLTQKEFDYFHLLLVIILDAIVHQFESHLLVTLQLQ